MLMRAGANVSKVKILAAIPLDTTGFGRVVSMMLQVERSQRRHQFFDLRTN
jgi:hypothetical protein